MRVQRRLGGLVAILIGALTFTGCASEQRSATPGDSSGSRSSSTESPRSDNTTESNADSGSGNNAQAPKSAAECLIGEWEADNAKFGALMASLMEEGGSVDEVAGTVLLNFNSQGQTSTSYTDWTLTMSVEGQTVSIIRNGIDAGTFTIDDDSYLTMTETSSTSTIVMKAAGIELGSQPATDVLPVTRSEFTCTTDLLTITANDATVEMNRR